MTFVDFPEAWRGVEGRPRQKGEEDRLQTVSFVTVSVDKIGQTYSDLSEAQAAVSREVRGSQR